MKHLTDDQPGTRYTWSGDFSIAYQVVGEGRSTSSISPAAWPTWTLCEQRPLRE